MCPIPGVAPPWGLSRRLKICPLCCAFCYNQGTVKHQTTHRKVSNDMSAEYKKIKQLAKESLMADFFAVRIDEESLGDKLKELILRIQLDSAPATAVKQMAKATSTTTEFIDQVKQANKWDWLRNLLVRLNLG